MNRLSALCAGLFTFVFLIGGNCSRTRVESINLMNEGVVLAAQKQYLQAAEKLERATAVDPTNDQAFWNLAIVHMEMHKFERARDDLQRAIDVNPQVAGYHEKLGTVLMELEDWQGAQTALGRAIELDAQLFKAHYKLGQVHERLDNPQEALREYTAAIQAGPRFIEAYRSLGRLYADLGYLDLAVQVLQSGLQVVIEGTEDEAHLHHLLGTVFQQQRNYDSAVAEFRSALRLMPSLREALFALGWTYALQDNREEARRYLKQYVDTAGGDAPRHYIKAAQDRLISLGGP
ncbi:MAG: tetratricopeptide repeat protein [Sandaracinaceae bacterium]|nr:tetratricopeptide repeat protein [Sandaracinaceae bacterium]